MEEENPNPLKNNILDSLFPPPDILDSLFPPPDILDSLFPQEEFCKNEGSADWGCPNIQNSANADGNSQDSLTKSQDTYLKANESEDSLTKSQDTYLKANESVFIDPLFKISSVEYGCRDYFFPISKQHPGSYDIGNTDQSPNVQYFAPADGNSQDSLSKSQDNIDPLFKISSVEYGCCDYFFPISKQHPRGYDIIFCSEGNTNQSPNVQNSAPAEEEEEDENTKAVKEAKAFMDNYFPVNKQGDILDSFFPPRNQQEAWKNEGNAADGNSLDSLSKSQDNIDPLFKISGVEYGCRDYFFPISKQHTGGYDIEKDENDGYDFPNLGNSEKDRKDDYEFLHLKNSMGEWWQGSYYY